MTYPRTVTAQLLNNLGTSVISGALDDAFGIQFMDELNGFGFGSCSLALSDPDADELVRGRFVQILVGGTVRFTFKIEGSPQYHQIDQGEEQAQFLTVSGRGWGCVWEEGIIYPEGPLDLPLDYTWRQWSFASIYFPNDGAWGAPTEQYEYFDLTEAGTRGRMTGVVDPGADLDDTADDELRIYVAPIGFPWPNAEKNGNGFAPTPTYVETFWLTADGAASEDDLGYHFFRGSFTLAGPQECKFTITADNLFTLFLDGVPILGEEDDDLMWTGWKEVTLVMPTGTHMVGIVFQNIYADIPYNPGGLLYANIAMAVYPGDTFTSETLALQTSNATDFPLSYFVDTDGDWPGWSPGQILARFAQEATGRGEMAAYVGDTFGTTTDSDGNTWDSIDPSTTILYIPTFSMRVGQNGGDMLRQMFEEGWIDWHFQPSTLTLDAWAQGTLGAVKTGLNFDAGVNIVGLERGETKPYANALLVQYSKGFTEVDDATEISSYGTRVADLLTTDAKTAAEAERLGRVELLRRMAASTAAVVVEIEPNDTTHTPYEGFELGDKINIPQIDGTGYDVVQVLSVSCEQDDEGYAKWRLECNARWRSPQAELVNVIRTIGGKSLGSVDTRGIAQV